MKHRGFHGLSRLLDRRGVTAVEFGIIAPVFLLMLFAVLGSGLIGFYQFLLDDSVRNAARQIQIDTPAANSPAGFVAAVCREFSLLAGDCSTKISYRVRASTQAAGFASMAPQPLPASGSLGTAFFASGASYASGVNLLVQVAYPLPFRLPYVATLVTLTGSNAILSTASARAEPYN